MSRSRTTIILGLAALAGGCTVAPRHEDVRVYQHERVVHDRQVVYETDAYEGYYYVRIVVFMYLKHDTIGSEPVVSRPLAVVLGVTLVATILLGVYPGVVFEAAEASARTLGAAAMTAAAR